MTQVNGDAFITTQAQLSALVDHLRERLLCNRYRVCLGRHV